MIRTIQRKAFPLRTRCLYPAQRAILPIIQHGILPVRHLSLVDRIKSTQISKNVEESEVDNGEILVLSSSKSGCASCGVKLQSENPHKEGFYLKPEERSLRIETNPTNTFESFKELELLNQLKELEGAEIPTYMQVASEKKNPDKRLKCQRCLDAIHHRIFEDKDFKYTTVEDVMKRIPLLAEVVHVVSALDFPLSVSKRVSKDRDPKRIWYIVTKVDAFYEREEYIAKYARRYFQDSLARLVDADPEKVFVVSPQKGWGTGKGFLSELPNKPLYFVGDVNVGKSSLIKTLLYRDNDKLRSKKHYGPGILDLPAFTRAMSEFKLTRNHNMTLIDTPGFFPQDNTVYKYILPYKRGEVPNVGKYTSVDPKKRQLEYLKKGRNKISGENVISIGGLFYLSQPENIVLRFFKGMNGEFFRSKSISKAIELSKHRDASTVEQYVVNELAADNLVRYVIPPFYGNVDVVLKGVGFLTLSPNGKFQENELFQIYVPKGVDVIVRESIFRFIYPSLELNKDTNASKDAKFVKGKPKDKRKRKVVLREIPTSKDVFTKLQPVDMDISNEEAFKCVVPESMFVRGIDSRSQEEYPNTYWRQPDLE